jgi:hypothetical protein
MKKLCVLKQFLYQVFKESIWLGLKADTNLVLEKIIIKLNCLRETILLDLMTLRSKIRTKNNRTLKYLQIMTGVSTECK